MSKVRKWCVVLLSFAMALSLTVSALAASAKGSAVLNVRFEINVNGELIGINSTDENPIIYTAYRIADISADAETGKYQYTCTPAFAGAGIDINAVLKGEQANTNIDACIELLTAFGSYINENAESIKQTAGADIRTAETERKSIGKTPRDGVAQFTDLKDGLYLISTKASVWVGGTQYVPYPLIVGIPYVYAGVSNNYLTATVKFDSETTPNTPPPPNTPTTPNTPPPNRPNRPNTPTVDIPEWDVPLSEPVIEILPDDVPLLDLPGEMEEPLIEIPDEDVPLAYLPQTGLLWWPVPVMAAAGIALVISGVLVRRRPVCDE